MAAVTDALAFWLREPGVGEIRPVGVPDPGAGEVLVRTLRPAVSRGTETLVFRGAVPEDQYATMRAPFQEGDFPGPVKYGYLNVGRRRGGAAGAARPHRVLPVPAPDVVRRPGERGRRRPRRRAGRAGGARRHRRDGGQRALGRRAAGRRPGHGHRRGHGRLLRRAAAGPDSRGRGHARRRRPGPGRGRRRARRPSSPARTTPTTARTWSSTPARPRPGCSTSLDLLAPRGHGRRAQLVRRHRGHAVARRRVPLRPARDPRQPGRHGRAGPARARTAADRLALALDLLRDPAFDALLTGASPFASCPT